MNKRKTVITKEEWKKVVKEYPTSYNWKEEEPRMWYNKDGDQIEIKWSNDMHVAHYINPLVTLYYSIIDKTKLIGLEICGICAAIPELIYKTPPPKGPI